MSDIQKRTLKTININFQELLAGVGNECSNRPREYEQAHQDWEGKGHRTGSGYHGHLKVENLEATSENSNQGTKGQDHRKNTENKLLKLSCST